MKQRGSLVFVSTTSTTTTTSLRSSSPHPSSTRPRLTFPDMYPRPDFERTGLRWQSLNGDWDFLFDDEDVGQKDRWFDLGLPAYVDLTGIGASNDSQFSESESITRKITDGTQSAIEGNFKSQKSAVTRNSLQTIKVPFVFQSPASGLNERGVHEVMWYQREITPPISEDEIKSGDRLLLRFGAVDYDAKVWVAGQYVGGHRGGHVPFDLDITDAVASSDANAPVPIIVRVYDSAYDLTQPRGKQYWGAKPESIFYTPSGGIWQNVWLETVTSSRIADSSNGTVIRSNDIDSGKLHASIAVAGRKAGFPYHVEIEASLAGVPVSKSEALKLPREKDNVEGTLSLRLSGEQISKLPETLTSSAPLDDARAWKDGVALWSPEFPSLYDLTIRLFDDSGETKLIDEVKTTTGMRSLDWTSGNGALNLNGRPYFQALCLDQGYWPDTFMTPPSPESLKADIELAKAMGFNGCRKHQKVEDPIFMYWADRLGYLVWGEMANAYQFSAQYVDRFNQEWLESVKRDINHPSIVTWTPVNESWGYTDLQANLEQRNHIRSLYYQTKTLDPSRPINDNCGWQHVLTDLSTFHDYSDSPALAETCSSLAGIFSPKANRPVWLPAIPPHDPGSAHVPGAPIICTEFGGVNIAPAKGAEDKEWGYTTAADPSDLLARIEKLVLAVVEGGHCSGFVWTQLSDIEQETNGLYAFDRTPKLPAAEVRAVMERALGVFYGNSKEVA
ncbi:family 2 glycoside hydrolase [Pseudovirgaria hyperparasitica]|uniref:Family 2 glycoside hydrolase n=1 Tax=Pseudovirgaria hyperparasitica TaxID=470096 RepID=A0A6A6WC44_9PEZI|nr:family 2 glycoside hydrolase [Pseudovirgaria hyperparasitica]KAF2759530.1 family 2 glycoside hydrolase [Pseudovirgaria hyperparasitica]